MVSTMRLYGAAIAVVSGGYSLWQATGGPEMVTAAWLMAAIGLVVLVHGVVLLTDVADRLGGLSGPLMIVWAVVMLLIQVLLELEVLESGAPDPMGGGMGDPMMGAAMGTDVGMVALAVLMLASGLIMTQRGEGSM